MAHIIYSTINDINQAKKIANILVGEKIVACVNIIPKIESIYRWKNKIEEDTECVIVAKTTDKNVEKTILKIKENHPYDLPAIIAFKIDKAHNEFLKYIKDETK